jgi:predicted ATPase
MLATRPYLRSIETKSEAKGRTEFPYGIPVLKNGDFKMEFPKNVTFFVGENGSGKSTIMEAIALACGFNPAGGSSNNLYDSRSTESSLSTMLRLAWNTKMNRGFFLRAESFFNFANHLEEMEELAKEIPMLGDPYAPYGGKSLHKYSHGESFMTLFEHRFKSGIFLLDEPEAALSPTRQLEFLARLHQLASTNDAQFIIATHSPILLSYPNAIIYEFSAEGFKKVAYTETEHYKITKDFLNSHESFLAHLLEEKSEN